MNIMHHYIILASLILPWCRIGYTWCIFVLFGRVFGGHSNGEQPTITRSLILEGCLKRNTELVQMVVAVSSCKSTRRC